MNVAEQMQEAISYDHHLLAHGLFLGLQKGYWGANDDASKIDFSKLNYEELEKVTEENLLDLETNKLHAVLMENKNFAMYFALDTQTVKAMHRKQFGYIPEKIIELEYGLDLSIYNPDTRKHQTWREIRQSMPILPAYAGLFRK